MENKYKITIPEPCHEDWNEMTSKENGRFCVSCSKTVVDFTSMLPEEVQHFFIQNQNERICGRFKNAQLDTISIQIPSRVLYSQTNYYKMFLLALFAAMGTTLFSCSDKNGDKQKIDKIEVVPEKHESFTTGMFVPVHDKVSSDAVDYNSIKNQGELDVTAHPEIGMTQYYEFIQKNYKIPKTPEDVISNVYVSFVIEKDGSLSDIKILRDFGYGSGQEAIRVLKMAPKWIPGKLDNHNVRSVFNMPLRFKN